MRPSVLLFCLLGVWAILALTLTGIRINYGLETAWVKELAQLWWLAGVAITLIATIDFFFRGRLNDIKVTRTLPKSLALGVNQRVSIHITNPYDFDLDLNVTDQYPNTMQVTRLPVSLTIKAGETQVVQYPIKPVRRGDSLFNLSQLIIKSSWGLWQRKLTLGHTNEVKVYPNFSPIAHMATVGIESRLSQLGAHKVQKRGQGMDFHQLREFRIGDAIRQIDWKASSRYQKPISRDYQDERDQDIIFLLDCGRRLRHKDDHLSHFDYSLNALLLTAFVALRQGDAAGVMSFAGDSRWLSPSKGQASINAILNQLYDLHSSTQSSDFLQAAEQLMTHYRKRSLIIIISNIREEDSADLIAATRLLSKQHVVVLANLQENFLSETVTEKVRGFDDAINYCSTVSFIQERQKLLRKLSDAGVIMVDSVPQQLHIRLAQEYLRIKRSGIL